MGRLGRVLGRLGAVQGAAAYSEPMRRGRGAAKFPPRGTPGRGLGEGKSEKPICNRSSDTPRAMGPANVILHIISLYTVFYQENIIKYLL